MQLFPQTDRFANEKRLVRLWQRCSLLVAMAVVAALFAFVPALRAQENSAITGTVTDASGAVIPNANLQLTDTATGQVRQSTSNGAGSFSLSTWHMATTT